MCRRPGSEGEDLVCRHGQDWGDLAGRHGMTRCEKAWNVGRSRLAAVRCELSSGGGMTRGGTSARDGQEWLGQEWFVGRGRRGQVWSVG